MATFFYSTYLFVLSTQCLKCLGLFIFTMFGSSFLLRSQRVNRSRGRSWLKRVASFTHMPSGSHETQLLASVHRLEAGMEGVRLRRCLYTPIRSYASHMFGHHHMFGHPPYVVIHFCDPFFFHSHAHIHTHRPLSRVPLGQTP